MDILVGSTGFVGTNLMSSHFFSKAVHKSDICDVYGSRPDLLVYAGVPAEMFLANKDPQVDWDVITNAFNNIIKIEPKQIVLISTIAVYSNTVGVDENTIIDQNNLSPYGKNRLKLEKMVREYLDKSIILRLPALYGNNLKKNFLYDFINYIPSMLSEQKYNELAEKEELIRDNYHLLENGFYKSIVSSSEQHKKLIECFKKVGFSALNFTDSRSRYQLYNLKNLWSHINIARENDIRLLNLAVEPIVVEELYYELTGECFKNELAQKPYNYDFRSIHFKELNGSNEGYIYKKDEIIESIRDFVLKERKRKGI